MSHPRVHATEATKGKNKFLKKGLEKNARPKLPGKMGGRVY